MAQNVIGTRAFDERNASYMRLIFNFKISNSLLMVIGPISISFLSK
jgi:hypothetical protein